MRNRGGMYTRYMPRNTKWPPQATILDILTFYMFPKHFSCPPHISPISISCTIFVNYLS